MTRLDGKALAAKIKVRVREEAAGLPRKPGLAVVLVGNDPASRVYVTSKRRDCEECGFYSEEYALLEETTQGELLELVETLNSREDIDGILVQLPLPGHLNEEAVIEAIDPRKDVDGFHPMNAGNLLIGRPGFLSCTPAGVMDLLEEYGIDPAGRSAIPRPLTWGISAGRQISWWRRWGGEGSSPQTWSRRGLWWWMWP